MTQYIFRHTAEYQMGDAGPSMGAHDYHVRTDLVRHLVDLETGISAVNIGCDIDTGSGILRGETFQFQFQVRNLLRRQNTGVRHAAFHQVAGMDLVDMHNVQFRLEGAAQLHGGFHHRIRCRR